MDGNFAEYLLADSNNVLPLPEELDFTDAVFIPESHAN
jgi:NADPH:quinone reductase-like Zn-dependent oxidoreductase